ncbi:hypothetical protein HO173_002984 [Letharia columbiana]|uniref:Uncharacterized protein n=1 Tax=Letharia columbiana TaxID=112416 RepID=A0A8H6G247_9LECA|nr:uncharacterized protein HO173_002984 [Letharia columbiana]KAF6239112.1 hypothetical protein HO173_002984 [Letharia columbiana]
MTSGIDLQALLSLTKSQYRINHSSPAGRGHVADTDAEIFQTLVREVYKETALSFNPVKASTKPFAYATEKTVKQGEEKVVLPKSSLQLNFVCEAAEDEVGGFEMTKEMRLVVEDAIRWKESQAVAIQE